MPVDGKKWWQSKTIVLNTVMSLLGIASLFAPRASGVQAFIGAHGSEIAVVWGMLGVALRMVTKDKIQLGD